MLIITQLLQGKEDNQKARGHQPRPRKHDEDSTAGIPCPLYHQ